MINKPLDQIAKADIEALISQGVAESRTLEYKEALPGGTDGDRKEFLADVSSFANASGGDIIYGVRDKRDAENKPTGIPESAVGLSDVNADAEKLRLDNMILSGIAPRINGLHIRPIDGFPNGPIIVIRVPKSWLAPHMLRVGDSRFYSRTSAGKHPLDVTEIRSAFALSEALPERVRQFRDGRIAKIMADETSVRLEAIARAVLHLFPVEAAYPAGQFSLASVDPGRVYSLLGARTVYSRYNLDGLLGYVPGLGNKCHSYVQVFRTGALEAVATLTPRTPPEEKYIPHVLLESGVIELTRSWLADESDWGVEPPLFLMLTLLGFEGWRMYTGPGVFPDEVTRVDRDVLFLPEVIVEDYGADVDRLLHPVFDALWQAAGYRSCPDYDRAGRWVERPGWR